MKPNKNHINIKKYIIENLIAFDLKGVRNAYTPKAALTFLPHIFEKLENDPKIKAIIKEEEKDLEKEKNIRQENLENSVLWYWEKIKLILTNCNFSSWIIEDARDLLEFKVFSLSGTNYIDLLENKLRFLLSIASDNKNNHEFFKEWTKNDEHFGLCIIYPVCVEKNSESISKDIVYKAWKERGYLSLSFLVEFLKTLSFHDKFAAIILNNLHCKNLKEYMQMQYQVSMGCYFSAFNSDDPLTFPLSNNDIILLLDSLIERLAEKLESPEFENNMHGKTKKNKECEQDLTPYARQAWKEVSNELRKFKKISRVQLVDNALKNLPCTFPIYKPKFLRDRMKVVIKENDPRIHENGKFIGLKKDY